MNYLFTASEVEELSEGLARQFMGASSPVYMDIEQFITDFLKLPIVYRSFAEQDTDKIGFISDGITPLWVYEHNKPTQRILSKGTIVLEQYLRTAKESNRRRFTLAHEAGHYIMDKTISRAYYHREHDRERSYNIVEFQELLNIREAQVDRLAAALLMPRFVVRNVLERFADIETIPLYGDSLLRMEDKLVVRKMAETMGVSYTACLIRLKELRLLKRHDISKYILEEIGLGEEAMLG